MKKTLSIILLVVASLIVVAVPSFLLIEPGKTEIKNAQEIKKLSNADLADAKNKISEKYLELSKKLDAKYVTKDAELEAEYSAKEKEIDAKYTKQMSEAGWFEEQNQKMNEKSKLESEKSTRSLDLFTQKNEEKLALSDEEDNEIDNLNKQNGERASLIRKGIIKIAIAAVIMLIFFGWIIANLNKVIRRKNSVKESWSQIEVILKKRYDLIPNLVSTVKGFAKHEKNTLESVTSMRSDAINTSDKAKEMELNTNLTKQMNHIMLLSESYPELKSDANFISLQNDLRDVEDEISKARERYNKSVLNYQNVIQTIPTNIFSNLLGYKDELFFSIDESEKEAPKVDLTDKQ